MSSVRIRATLVAIAGGILASCGNNSPAVAPLPPGPVVSVPPGTTLITITYFGRPETAKERGSCPEGYTQGVPPVTSQGAPFRCVYDSFSSDPLTAEIGRAYPFDLGSLHCGLSVAQFDGHLYVPDALGPAWSVGAPSQYGTMTLTSANHASFQGMSGSPIPLHAVSSVRLPPCA